MIVFLCIILLRLEFYNLNKFDFFYKMWYNTSHIKGEYIVTKVNDLERLKALRRIVFQLPKSEAENIEYKFNNGLKTGYATLDRPWEKYYSEYVKNFEFPKKTMYQCIYDCNKNH